MYFLWPHNLWWMLLLPLLPALYVWRLRRARKSTITYPGLGIVREAAGRPWRRHVAPALMLTALALLLLDPTRPSVGQALSGAGRRAGRFILASLIVAIPIGAGLWLFVLPGLYLQARLVMTVPVLAANPAQGAGQAVTASWAGTRPLALGLFGAVTIMLLQLLGFVPGGGTALSLSGAKLAIGFGGNFVLGALMTLGIGLYAPCMILISMLGMNPTAAFPIMMNSCAFLPLMQAAESSMSWYCTCVRAPELNNAAHQQRQ